MGGFWAGAWDLLCHLPAWWPGLSPASCRLSSRAGTSVGADWFVDVTLSAGSATRPSPAPARHAGDQDRLSDLGEWNGSSSPTCPAGTCLELSRTRAVFLVGCLAISFPSVFVSSLLIIPLFVLILVHWNLKHSVCKLLESVSPFCLACLSWGETPKTSGCGVQGGCSPPALLILVKHLLALQWQGFG